MRTRSCCVLGLCAADNRPETRLRMSSVVSGAKNNAGAAADETFNRIAANHQVGFIFAERMTAHQRIDRHLDHLGACCSHYYRRAVFWTASSSDGGDGDCTGGGGNP